MRKIPVICINLSRATERKEFIESEWVKKRGVDVTFFDGFDASKIKPEKLPEPYRSNIKKQRKGWYNHSTNCCCISHCEALKSLIDGNFEEGIIIEDDAIPLFETSDEFYSEIEKCKSDMEGVNVLFLHRSTNVIGEHLIKEKRSTLNVLTNGTTCAQAIYYNRQGMIDAYNDASRMTCAVDTIWDISITKKHALAITNRPLTEHPKNSTTYIDHRGHRLYVQTNLQDSILQSFLHFQAPHVSIAPFYNSSGITLDQSFLRFFTKNIDKLEDIKQIYVPICWADLYYTATNQAIYKQLQYGLNKLKDLQGASFFVVTEHIGNIHEQLPANTTIFSIGDNAGGENIVPLPHVYSSKITDSNAFRRVEKECGKDIFCTLLYDSGCDNKIAAIKSKCIEEDYNLFERRQTIQFSPDQQKDYISTCYKSKFVIYTQGSVPCATLYEIMDIGAVPVYVYHELHLPYNDIVSWKDLCIFVHIDQINNINDILRSIDDKMYSFMLESIKQAREKVLNLDFTYDYIVQHLKKYRECSIKGTVNISESVTLTPRNIQTYNKQQKGIDVTPPSSIHTTIPTDCIDFLHMFETIKAVYPGIEIQSKYIDNTSDNRNYTIQKLTAILEMLEESKASIFIYCDVDTQFFNPFHLTVNKLLNTADIVFLRDSNNQPCMNFFACRNIPIVRKMLKKMHWLMKERVDVAYFEHDALKGALNRFGSVKRSLIPKDLFIGNIHKLDDIKEYRITNKLILCSTKHVSSIEEKKSIHYRVHSDFLKELKYNKE